MLGKLHANMPSLADPNKYVVVEYVHTSFKVPKSRP